MTASFRSKNIDNRLRCIRCIVCAIVAMAASADAQTPTPAAATAAAAPRPTDPVVPPGYVIGTDDVLSIV